MDVERKITLCRAGMRLTIKDELKDLKNLLEEMKDYESSKEASQGKNVPRYISFLSYTEMIVRHFQALDLLESLVDEYKDYKKVPGAEENEEKTA